MLSVCVDTSSTRDAQVLADLLAVGDRDFDRRRYELLEEGRLLPLVGVGVGNRGDEVLAGWQVRG